MICRPLSILALALILPCTAHAQGMVISEVMFNPDGDENAREYVELYNAGTEAVSLEGWSVGDGEDTDLILPAREQGWTVSPGSFALIFDPDYTGSEEPYSGIPAGTPVFIVDDKAIGSRGLSNSTAEPITLFSADGDILSSVTYSLDCPPGHSWERIRLAGDDSQENFAPSKGPEGTPGRLNSTTPPHINPAISTGDITISPETPSMGETVTISVRCRNAGTDPIENPHVTVMIQPDITVQEYTFPGGLAPGEISGEVYIDCHPIPGGLLSVTAVVDAQDASPGSAYDDTLTVTLDIPIPEDTILLTEIMAAPLIDHPEWIEVLNCSETPVDLFGWTVKDGDGNRSQPISGHMMVAGRAYALIAEEFPEAYLIPDDVPVCIVGGFPSLNNDGDEVFVCDSRDEIIDEASWDDAPAGVSLERIDETPGDGHGWDICVDTEGATPGKANSILFTDDGDGSGGITITAEPNPFEDTTRISYSLPFPLARVRLMAYDRRGRLVREIRDADESGSEWSGYWDGCDDSGDRLSAGPYILFFEALDKQTGGMATEKVPIVVAKRL